MIDPSSALLSVPSATSAPVVVADGAAASSGGFARTLGTFLDAREAALEPQTATPLVRARQAAAETGKDLPQAAADDADTPDAAAIPLWFAPIPLPAVTIAPPPETGATIAATAPPLTRAAATDQPVEAEASPATATPAITDPLSSQPMPLKSSVSAANAIQILQGFTAKPVIDAPSIAADAKAAPLPIDTSAQAIVVSTLPQPAGQIFASARAIAGSWRERAPVSEVRDQVDVLTSFASAAPIDLRERAIVQAAAHTANAALDLTADPGLQQMIDRIETLRDAANATDTRVRLVPDALGSIDVAVRQDGDRVHVRFTAEHEATRVLIAEAQPRLSELAAARGLRIGDTSVSTGTGGSGGTAPQPRTAPPRAPVSAMPEAPSLSPTDHRLA